MPGRHDSQQQAWLNREVHDLLRLVVEQGHLSQREHLDRAVGQYCRRRLRVTKRKARKAKR